MFCYFFIHNFNNSFNRIFKFYNFSKSSIHYNSVKIHNKKLSKKNKCRVGFVGRLENEKGINKFLQISKFMEESEFSFKVFGKGSYEKKILEFSDAEYYSIEYSQIYFSMNDFLKEKNKTSKKFINEKE